ncbi:carboxymuconolactone decarboxylase [Klebsiella michiganensis]|nr:carboxymuconolactone decarboxylase [Klebsiella michiganensis]
MTSERYTIGREMLQRVDGKGGDAVVNSLKDIAPDFARYLIEFPLRRYLRQARARFTQP